MSSNKLADSSSKVSKPKAREVVEKPVVDIFERTGKKAPLLALAALFIICFLVFKDYLFMDKAYFFKDIGSDSYNYNYPFLYHVADYMSQYGLPKWSFSYGMGQNLLPFFLRDPFDIFLLLAGKDHIMFGAIFKEVAKIILGGLTFYYYLKALKLSNFTSLIGCILFAFCGFTIVGSGWQIFSFESFNFALLLLSFELLLSKKNWYLFPIAIFLICISQPFNLYVYGLFMAVYAIFRLLQQGPLNVKETGLLFGKMIGLGLLGMLISAPFMLENIVQLLESPRGSGTNSYAKILSATPMFKTADQTLFGTSMMRLFSSDMLGSGSEFKGWQNFLEAPLFYSGLLCLLLMPQVFQFLEKRVKVIFGVFITFWLLPIVFPYFRYAFWLFTGDYFRAYSVVVTVVLIYYSAIALDLIIAKRKVNLIVLISTIVLLFILLNYPYFPENILHPGVSIFVSFMLVVYAVMLFLVGRGTNITSLKYGLLLAVMLEALYLSGRTANDRDPVQASELTEKKGYNDYTTDALKLIKQSDKSFYRIDKTYASSPAIHYSLNDALAQGYYGTTEYSPFNQVYFIYYLQLMGISDKKDELQSRWATGLSTRPILESENRVKYILAKTQVNPIWNVICDSVATVGDVKVFRNKFLLPFGYSYSKYIKEGVYSNLSNVQKDFVSLKACVVKDEDVKLVSTMKEFNLADTIAPSAFNFDIYRQDVNGLSKDSMTVSTFRETDIAGKINVSEDKIMYLSIPYDGGWTLKVDGKPTNKTIVFAGMTGVILPKGSHTIEMHYELRYWHKGLIIAVIGLLAYLGLFLVQKRMKSKPKTEEETRA